MSQTPATQIRAYAAKSAGAKLEPITYDAGPLAAEDVEITVTHCGICHSDISVINNDWGMSTYPAVPGHEVIGVVTAVGTHARGLKIGQRVGVGWNAGSCLCCHQCLGGDQHLCAKAQATIVAHNGGFAEKVRSHWAWAIPLPEGLDPASAGPLLCGGITVFSPLFKFGIKPPHRVGVVGIGGLGHMALKFAEAWGCEVTAFTSSASKVEEAKKLGAHKVVSSTDSAAMNAIAGTLDLVIVTVNVTLDWNAILATLAPKGRLHVVGAVLEPIPVPAFTLIMGERQVSGSPTGSPTDIATMLEFAARHKIAPVVEYFPMSKVNDALDHLKAGKARYRIVLTADF